MHGNQSNGLQPSQTAPRNPLRTLILVIFVLGILLRWLGSASQRPAAAAADPGTSQALQRQQAIEAHDANYRSLQRLMPGR
jgi:hypothetical protein